MDKPRAKQAIGAIPQTPHLLERLCLGCSEACTAERRTQLAQASY